MGANEARSGHAGGPLLDQARLTSRLRSPDVTMTTLSDGSGILVDLTGLEILMFNPTGTLIVTTLREGDPKAPDEIARVVAERFNADIATVTKDVLEFLTILKGIFSCRAPSS